MSQGQHSPIQGELVTAINAVTKANRIAWAFPELRCTYPAGSHPADVYGGGSIVPDVAVFQWERLPVNEGYLYTSRTIAPSFPNPFSRWEKGSRIEAPRPPGEGFGERGNGLVHQVCNYL